MPARLVACSTVADDARGRESRVGPQRVPPHFGAQPSLAIRRHHGAACPPSTDGGLGKGESFGRRIRQAQVECAGAPTFEDPLRLPRSSLAVGGEGTHGGSIVSLAARVRHEMDAVAAGPPCRGARTIRVRWIVPAVSRGDREPAQRSRKGTPSLDYNSPGPCCVGGQA
jgi:hypothetical protein